MIQRGKAPFQEGRQSGQSHLHCSGFGSMKIARGEHAFFFQGIRDILRKDNMTELEFFQKVPERPGVTKWLLNEAVKVKTELYWRLKMLVIPEP